MLYSSPDLVPWDSERWPNFRPEEPKLACSCCGEFYLDEYLFDRLQAARNIVGPLTIWSGHRCKKYNQSLEKEGAAKNSQHLRLAFDIAIREYDRMYLYYALSAVGFTTFGFYKNFIHVDRRPNRRWFGAGARSFWPDI